MKLFSFLVYSNVIRSTFVFLFLFLLSHLYAITPDWSSTATLPGKRKCKVHNAKEYCYRDGNRENIYKLGPRELNEVLERGAKHALVYPVSSTELLAPLRPLEALFSNAETEELAKSILKNIIRKILGTLTKIHSLDEAFEWMGLHQFPDENDERNSLNLPHRYTLNNKSDFMGVTLEQKFGAQTATLSCATCHSSNLFGTKILGMANRFPRANEVFKIGKLAVEKIPSSLFRSIFSPTRSEELIYETSKNALRYVYARKPVILGLDTSLAQVGLGLAIRARDEYATRNTSRSYRKRELNKHYLNHYVADSKPQYWWNLKYKTKWLSDASVRSGNPIHTNFLWNEIGRGANLKTLEKWMKTNPQVIKELTAFAFATKAPKYNDYFPNDIHILQAKKGQKLFIKNCSGCHGTYEKGWDQLSQNISYEDKIKTTKVWYFEKTQAINVGTDPLRAKGMASFQDNLNSLKISKELKVHVDEQLGYVPPPLVGVWARWPYFHNNSVPTLYDVLTPDFKRPKSYIATAAISKEVDFDKEKNGYPAPYKIREKFKANPDYLYDTQQVGLSNRGHTKMLLNQDGTDKFSHKDKLNIIEFLKTL